MVADNSHELRVVHHLLLQTDPAHAGHASSNIRFRHGCPARGKTTHVEGHLPQLVHGVLGRFLQSATQRRGFNKNTSCTQTESWLCMDWKWQHPSITAVRTSLVYTTARTSRPMCNCTSDGFDWQLTQRVVSSGEAISFDCQPSYVILVPSRGLLITRKHGMSSVNGYGTYVRKLTFKIIKCSILICPLLSLSVPKPASKNTAKYVVMPSFSTSSRGHKSQNLYIVIGWLLELSLFRSGHGASVIPESSYKFVRYFKAGGVKIEELRDLK